MVNANWATLTNSTQMVGETNVFVGGLYIDQTAVFGGDLIVVSGGTGSEAGDTGGAVWRVTASGNATKLAQVSNPANGADTLLEGVTTVPNDPFKYGPFAGKILTCAEKLRAKEKVRLDRRVLSSLTGLDSYSRPNPAAPIRSRRRVATVEHQGARKPQASLRDASYLFASHPRVKTRGYRQSLAPRGRKGG